MCHAYQRRPQQPIAQLVSRPNFFGHMLVGQVVPLHRAQCLVQPRIHLTRYPGVLAPNDAWRSLIVLKPPVKPALELPRRGDWASLLRRVFAIEVLVCSFCGGERRVIAEIKEGPVARQILAHLGLPTRAPKPAQGSLFPIGPPAVDEPEASVARSDSDYHQRLPDSVQFA